MPNQSFEEWCMNTENYKDNLKVVMWSGKKVPVSNFMCPICNTKKALKKLHEAQLIDPDCVHPETQKLIHDCRGWSQCDLAIMDNRVYHLDCLKKKMGKKFDGLVESGEILAEKAK
jgi:hypothetical protein